MKFYVGKLKGLQNRNRFKKCNEIRQFWRRRNREIIAVSCLGV
jgi:hypothetical protein